MTFLEATLAALKAKQFVDEYIYIQKTTWRSTCFLRINRNEPKKIEIIDTTTTKEISQVDLVNCNLTTSDWRVPDKDPTTSDKS